MISASLPTLSRVKKSRIVRAVVKAGERVKISPWGNLSFFGLYAVIVVASIFIGDWSWVAEMIQLLTFQVSEISAGGQDLWGLFKLMLPLLVIEIPLAFLCAGIVSAVLTKHKGNHSVSSMLLPTKNVGIFKALVVIVLLEEIFARWLFLDVFTRIPGLDGTFGFYLMFLLGNGIWALIHLGNFTEEADRHPLRVLPQFVGGITLTYFYLKFGLSGALLLHFAYNSIVFATAKVQRVSKIDIVITSYSAVVAVVSYMALSRDPLEFIEVLGPNWEAALATWAFWDLFWLSLLVSGALGFAADLFLFDRSNLPKYNQSTSSESGASSPGATLVSFFVGLTIVLMLFPLIIDGAFKGLSIISVGGPVAAILTAIFFCALLRRGNSANAATRTFWVAVPTTLVITMAIASFPYWTSVGFFAVTLAAGIPRDILKAFDD